MKRIAPLAAALLLVATALSMHLVTAGGGAARSGRISIRRVHVEPGGRVVRGRTLLRPGARKFTLAAPASAPLVGNLGPVAAPSRDGRFVAYNTWRWARAIDWRRSLGDQGIDPGDPLGTPQVHIRDLRLGTDEALEPGSFSVAWRAGGALAYVRGATPSYRAGVPYSGDVVVRSGIGEAPVVWSQQPGRYVVEAWAGRRLLVRRAVEGESGDLVVYDRPGSGRTLAADADLVAVAPNGDEALVVASAGETAMPFVALVSTADGREESRIALDAIRDPLTKAPLEDVVGIGSWRSGEAVAASSDGLVVFRAGAGHLAVEQVLHVDDAAKPGGGFYEPQLSPDGRTIVTWADVPASGGRRSAQFVCDRYALTCDEGAAVPSPTAPRPVYDPGGGDG